MRKGNFSEELQLKFARRVRECSWYRPGLKMAAAVSGGADSVALLTLLAEASGELGIVLSAVHLNHKLRGRASDGDEKFVAALAERFGITLHIGHADIAARAKVEKANLEETARRARYSFFEKLADQEVVDAVATAHSMDDQAETVLAHILRGTGIAGLAGIHEVAGHVCRPLLDFRRSELRKYLRTWGQTWREDASNRDTSRMRARMRQTLMPLLEKKFNPGAVEHLATLAERAGEQASFMELLGTQVLNKYVERTTNGARIGIAELLDPLRLNSSELESTAGDRPAATSPLSALLIERIADRTKTRRGQWSANHLEMVLRLARTGETGKRLELPGGVDVVRERETLVFHARPARQS